MSVGGSGFNANFNIAAKNMTAKKEQTDAASAGLPAFDHGRVWGSLGAFGDGLKEYQKEWEAVYSEKFSGLENGGKISVDEMQELLQSEFSRFGIRFVNSDPRDVTDGQHKVYIDDANMQKMANDPEYRGKVMALMQRELTNTQQGFSYQRNGETQNPGRLSGTVISISQENNAYGGIPYSGMARGSGSISVSKSSIPTASDRASDKKGKSMLEIIKEMQEEREKKLEEKREKARIEARKKEREEQVTVSSDVSAEITSAVVEDSPTIPEPPTTGGSLDVVG